MKILVLNVNVLHLGYLGCYGNEWVETPTLDGLAAEGVVFDFHLADCPSQPTSALTGRHSVRDATDLPTIPVILHEHGIAAATLDASQHDDLDTLLEDIDQAIENIAQAEKAFLWLEWPDMRPPWAVPEEILDLYFDVEVTNDPTLTPWLEPPTGAFDPADGNNLERLQETYAAVTTFFDACVEMVLEILDRHGGRDSWLLIITAGSGMTLGERGSIGETTGLHEEVIHIPLLMHFPDRVHAGMRVAALTQPVDLLPTIVDLFGLPPAPGDGHSLLPLVNEQVDEVRRFACSVWGADWSLRTAEWAFLLPHRDAEDDTPRRTKLYVKPDDRWEMNDLSQHNLDLCDELEKTLRDHVAEG